MSITSVRSFLIVLLGLALSVTSHASMKTQEQEINNIMRLIGHELLIDCNDSISRVSPITKAEERYKISFETDISLNPSRLIGTVDSIIVLTDLANNYLLEIESCDSMSIVYSYQINNSGSFDVIPCASRIYPKACYSILLTFIEYRGDYAHLNNIPKVVEDSAISLKTETIYSYILLVASAAILLGIYFYKKKSVTTEETRLITIGKFEFDQINMKLIHKREEIELTGKEADLLQLLHSSANKTIERDVILNKVWGDEGDYVGRTLDVFISKLRKKLEADPSLKIRNIRGVGYRLVID